MKKQKIKISASLLSADFANLAKEIKALEKANVDEFHLDIMDGNFVQNISFGASVIKKIRPYTKKVFDTHLMILNPFSFIKNFVDAGSDIITIHIENKDCIKCLKEIKKYKIKAGIAISPTISINMLKQKKEILNYIDRILVMTVNPGFGGQKFIDKINKIKELKNIIGKKNIEISVDGGINEKTAKICKNAGADILVSGSFIFNKNYKNNIKILREV